MPAHRLAEGVMRTSALSPLSGGPSNYELYFKKSQDLNRQNEEASPKLIRPLFQKKEVVFNATAPQRFLNLAKLRKSVGQALRASSKGNRAGFGPPKDVAGDRFHWTHGNLHDVSRWQNSSTEQTSVLLSQAEQQRSQMNRRTSKRGGTRNDIRLITEGSQDGPQYQSRQSNRQDVYPGQGQAVRSVDKQVTYDLQAQYLETSLNVHSTSNDGARLLRSPLSEADHLRKNGNLTRLSQTQENTRAQKSNRRPAPKRKTPDRSRSKGRSSRSRGSEKDESRHGYTSSYMETKRRGKQPKYLSGQNRSLSTSPKHRKSYRVRKGSTQQHTFSLEDSDYIEELSPNELSRLVASENVVLDTIQRK